MLPIILGVAAAAIFLSGCDRHEENIPRPAERPPEPSQAPAAATRANLPLRTIPLSLPSATSAPGFTFAPILCRNGAPRPARFAIQDPRAEFCRLHELLRGASCRIEGDRVALSEERTLPSIFALIPNLSDRSDFGAVIRDPALREKLAALEGLQTYLYSGQPCQFDQLGDLMDLMEAYSLYRATYDSPQPALRRAFREGRAGCILIRGLHRDEGAHDHQLNGQTIHHAESHDHDAILTPATVALEGLAETTAVSDCLVLR